MAKKPVNISSLFESQGSAFSKPVKRVVAKNSEEYLQGSRIATGKFIKYANIGPHTVQTGVYGGTISPQPTRNFAVGAKPHPSGLLSQDGYFLLTEDSLRILS